MLMFCGPLKFELRTFWNVNLFPKISHFYPTPKNEWSKHDFFVLLNAPVGVHERVKNLLNRIGVRDLLFCDYIFHDFEFRKKTLKPKNLLRLPKFEYVKEIIKLHNVYYILFKGRKLVFRSLIFSYQRSYFLVDRQKIGMLIRKSYELPMQDLNI